jgi:hypothetical protein
MNIPRIAPTLAINAAMLFIASFFLRARLSLEFHCIGDAVKLRIAHLKSGQATFGHAGDRSNDYSLWRQVGMDLNNACSLQYGAGAHVVLGNRNYPYSWSCAVAN